MAAKNNKSMKKASGSPDIKEKISKKAYELFEKRGYSHGDDLSDWFEAEKIIKGSRR